MEKCYTEEEILCTTQRNTEELLSGYTEEKSEIYTEDLYTEEEYSYYTKERYQIYCTIPVFSALRDV